MVTSVISFSLTMITLSVDWKYILPLLLPCTGRFQYGVPLWTGYAP